MPEPTTVETKRRMGRPRKYDSPGRTVVQGYSLPPDLVDSLVAEAKTQGVSASTLVAQAIRDLLNRRQIKAF